MYVYHEVEGCSIEDVFSDKMDLFIQCPNNYLDTEAHSDKYIPNSKYNGNEDVLSMYAFPSSTRYRSIGTPSWVISLAFHYVRSIRCR